MKYLKEESSRFALLLKEETEKRKTLPDAIQILRDHEQAIREARTFRISHAKIAQLLSDSGVAASIDIVRSFCRTVLNETPKLRRKRGKKIKPERAKSNLTVKKAVSNPLATKSSARKSTTKPTTPAQTKPGKTGFRVAQDEDL